MNKSSPITRPVCASLSPSERHFSESALLSRQTQNCSTAGGKSVAAVKKTHRAENLSSAAFAKRGGRATAYLVAELFPRSVGAGLASAGVGVLFLLERTAASLRQSDELKTAYARDAIHLAFVYSAARALPQSYVQSKRHEMRAVDGHRGGAMKILNRLMKNDSRWQKLRASSEREIDQGRKLAKKYGVTSDSALKRRLGRDRSFKHAYTKSLAFKHAVDSVVFEAEQKRPARKP